MQMEKDGMEICDKEVAPSLEREESGRAAQASREEEKMFNEIESRIVRRWKLLTVSVLLLSTCSVALTVFFYTSNGENREFEKQFHNDANKVLGDLGTKLDLSLTAIDALVVSMVSLARFTNQTWPFCTIPDFEIRASKIRSISGAVYLNIYPLVAPEERDDWEKYTAENNYWVDESIEVQSRDDTYHGPIIREYETFDKIHTHDYAENGTSSQGPYLPIWQSSPVIPTYPPYNWDLYSSYDTSSIDMVFETHRAVISEAYMVSSESDDAEKAAENEAFADWFKDYIDPDEEAMEPVSDIYYPMVDSAEKVRIIGEDYNKEDSEVVGFLSLSIYWRDFIRNILDEGSVGIMVVFENPCNPSFTYELNGPEVTYKGTGDQHDHQFNYLGHSAVLFDLSAFSKWHQSYTGIPVNQDYCPMTVHVYPSTRMEDDYISRDPVVFTVSVVLIFAFSSAVFLVYDYCVERRNRHVTRTVVESQVNVSLLEKMVKDRTRTLEITNERLEQANEKITQASARQLQHFACMSHELRTPLNCILGISSLLSDSDLDTEHKESVEMIYSSGELLRFIIDDVLDFSKLESGAFKMEMRRASLQEALSTVVRSIESNETVVKKNLKIQTLYDANVGEYLTTDHRRLQQVLYNLLSNATKFSHTDCDVELNCFYSYPESDKTRKYLRFSVKDYGKGIPKEHFDVIFNPFNEASIETETIYGGTGLGLSISKRLVEALGGLISFDSVEGAWTEFRVDIPADDDSADMASISSRLKNVVVALVDADANSRCAVARSLRNCRVDFIQSDSMRNLRGSMPVGNKTMAFLVRSDLYEDTAHLSLTQGNSSVLVTFGNSSSSKKSQKTYRSLRQMLPSVLMKDLGDLAAEVVPQAPSTSASIPHQAPDVQGDKAAASYRDLRVLIAEDNLVNQKVLSRILTRLDVQNVKIVGNGQEAVDLERTEPFDLILMDMQMPVLDGLGACRKILARTDGGDHPVPQVIFVTAHVSKDFERQCREAGAVDFLSKPCNLKLVEECLTRFAQSRK